MRDVALHDPRFFFLIAKVPSAQIKGPVNSEPRLVIALPEGHPDIELPELGPPLIIGQCVQALPFSQESRVEPPHSLRHLRGMPLPVQELGQLLLYLRDVLGKLPIVFQDSLVHNRPDQMGAGRDLWVLLKKLFEIPDAHGANVIERLDDDPVELLYPALVHLCDDVNPRAWHRYSAGSIVVEAEQHPPGNIEHEPPAFFLTGKSLVQVLELVPQRLV
jgi:hypothetical protein